MVAVIEDRREAGAAQCIEFVVRRSPDDPERVQGSWRLVHDGRTIDQNKPDTAVLTEFRFAVDCADQHGIPFLWVDDPEELFPPWVRR